MAMPLAATEPTRETARSCDWREWASFQKTNSRRDKGRERERERARQREGREKKEGR